MQNHRFSPSSAPARGSSSRRPFFHFILTLSILAGSGAALSGCGDAASDAPFKTVFNPCEPLVIVAQAGISSAELESLNEAVAMWNDAAGLALIRAQERPSQERLDAPHIPIYFEDGAPFVHGYYSDELGTVTLNHKLSPRQRTITAAHELGHAFGLRHIPETTRASLMNPGNLRHTITPEDVETLHHLWPSCPSNAETKDP